MGAREVSGRWMAGGMGGRRRKNWGVDDQSKRGRISVRVLRGREEKCGGTFQCGRISENTCKGSTRAGKVGGGANIETADCAEEVKELTGDMWSNDSWAWASGVGGVLAEEMVEQIEEVKDFFNINVRYYVSVCLEHSLEKSGVLLWNC